MHLPSELKLTISGARGKAPGDLTPEVAYTLAWSFAAVMGSGPLIVSRDSRPSGHALKKAVLQALHDQGREILDADLIPLPTTQVAIEKYHAAGAIDVTASHNPIEWNGLKFLGPDGTFVQDETIQRIRAKCSELEQATLRDEEIPVTTYQEEAVQAHLNSLLPLAVPGKKLIIAVDAVNGAGSYIIPRLLEALDCTVIPLATNPDEIFPHPPEPTPANLVWTQEQLQGKTYDVALVIDPDADRLALIDENGTLLSEECLLPLIAEELCAGGKSGTIVVNNSTSIMTELVTRDKHCSVMYAPVGEINIINAMRSHSAFFGGEGCGGAINPAIHYGRDALVGVLHVINLLRRTNKRMSELAAELPQLVMKKEKFPLPKDKSLEDIYLRITKALPPTQPNREDGLYLRWEDSWLSIRPSNTEPILRLIGEAPTEAQLDSLLSTAASVL